MTLFRAIAAIVVLGTVSTASAAEPDREYQELQTDNRLWRAVDPRVGLETNLKRLREQGFTAADLDRNRAPLEEVLDVPGVRHFGSFPKDLADSVREIDRAFAPLLRAERLFQTAGVRHAICTGESEPQLQQRWNAAIRAALPVARAREFFRNNSANAQLLYSGAREIKLTRKEFSELCRLADDILGDTPLPTRTQPLSPEPDRARQREFVYAATQLLGGARLKTLLAVAETR